jgi:hypothetical protein
VYAEATGCQQRERIEIRVIQTYGPYIAVLHGCTNRLAEVDQNILAYTARECDVRYLCQYAVMRVFYFRRLGGYAPCRRRNTFNPRDISLGGVAVHVDNNCFDKWTVLQTESGVAIARNARKFYAMNLSCASAGMLQWRQLSHAVQPYLRL